MKVFISGSKCFNYRIEGERWRLTDSIKKYLDKLISEENEILIGDCEGLDYMVQFYLHYAGYKNVIVYVSGGKKGSLNNEGNMDRY